MIIREKLFVNFIQNGVIIDTNLGSNLRKNSVGKCKICKDEYETLEHVINCALPSHISKETIESYFIYKDNQIDLENTIELLSRVDDYLLLGSLFREK